MKKIKILRLTKEERKEMQDSYSVMNEDERKKTGDVAEWIDKNSNQTYSTLEFIKNNQLWNDTEKLINLVLIIKKTKVAKEFLIIENDEHKTLLEAAKLRNPTYNATGQVLDSGFRISGSESEKYIEVYQSFIYAKDYEVKE